MGMYWGPHQGFIFSANGMDFRNMKYMPRATVTKYHRYSRFGYLGPLGIGDHAATDSLCSENVC